MKLVALVEAVDHVCCRYRVAAFSPFLFSRGWSLETWPLEKGWIARAQQLRRAAAADVVLLQRHFLPWWQLACLRRWTKRLVYDFDDAVFYRDCNSTKEPFSRMRLASFWLTLQVADGISAGNRFLAEHAAEYVPESFVKKVPTTVDPQVYTLARHYRRGGDARLVWIGSRSTLPSLPMISDGLAQAAAMLPGLALRVVCDDAPQIDGIRIVRRPWSTETECCELAEGDIGISWLPEHPSSPGKCGLKVLQYHAAGLPVVANAVGLNRELVINGQNGFLVETPRQFAAAVKRLADDPDLRTRLGAAGRRQVEDDYSIDRWGPEFADWIDRLGRVGPKLVTARSQRALSPLPVEAG